MTTLKWYSNGTKWKTTLNNNFILQEILYKVHTPLLRILTTLKLGTSYSCVLSPLITNLHQQLQHTLVSSQQVFQSSDTNKIEHYLYTWCFCISLHYDIIYHTNNRLLQVHSNNLRSIYACRKFSYTSNAESLIQLWMGVISQLPT